MDVQQARTLLLSTQASIPQLETALIQTRNALSILLGELPGKVETLLTGLLETDGIKVEKYTDLA